MYHDIGLQYIWVYLQYGLLWCFFFVILNFSYEMQQIHMSETSIANTMIMYTLRSLQAVLPLSNLK